MTGTPPRGLSGATTGAGTLLPTPPAAAAHDPDAAVAWVAEHLGDLALEGPAGVVASRSVRGGQQAADTALALLDVTGYAARRSEVWPVERRGASRMSPYVRHGLVDLRAVWDAVADAPARDRQKYREELLWQEYARHLYARTGAGLARPLRHAPATGTGWRGEAWPAEMLCMAETTGELRADGWLVNQTRMWLSSQWTVRAGRDWREGEDEFFRHLVDGSRAANRLGWQWTVGTGTGRPYGFSRWQVEKRAPGMCARCPLQRACPVQQWPDPPAPARVAEPPGLAGGADGPALQGPATVQREGEPRAVWLTFESLGERDPALDAHPDLPVVVVFDEPLLARLRLSGKRLVFLAETVAGLAAGHEVLVHRGRPQDVLRGSAVAVTHAPVPGFARRAAAVRPVETHPWPWLVRPGSGTVRSFTAWRRRARV